MKTLYIWFVPQGSDGYWKAIGVVFGNEEQGILERALDLAGLSYKFGET